MSENVTLRVGPPLEPIYFWSKSEEYSRLSNFSNCNPPVVYRGNHYKSVEAAYQAQKIPANKRTLFTTMTPYEARNYTRGALLPEYWHQDKVEIMSEILAIKFSDKRRRNYLCSTGERQLIHFSPWDTFWGWSPQNGGENVLGKLLMDIRFQVCKYSNESLQI